MRVYEVITHQVLTVGGMNTYIKGTFISVLLTVHTLKPWGALTSEVVHMVMAGAPVLAGSLSTVINVHLTVPPCRRKCEKGIIDRMGIASDQDT